jgi:hypothetical protein
MPDVESNPLFGLLTDALRAGPGSPEWHQAVGKLRADGLADSDEYRLLVAVREHLESGREYRSIRAGPGFTRRVMAAVEQERRHGRRPSGVPVANAIAVVAGVVVLGLLVALAYQLFPRGGAGGGGETVEELEQTYFPTELAAARFDGAVPAGWRTVGALPLEAGRTGLRPAPATQPGAPSTTAAPTTVATSPEPVGGAVVAPAALPATDPFAAVVQLRPGRPTDDLIVQVFVSAEGDFSPDKATTANELVWLIQGTKQKVVVGDRVEAEAPRTEPAATANGGGGSGGGSSGAAKADPLTVRVVVGKQQAVVSVGSQRLWAGPHGLANKPRTVGVRFIRVDGTKPAEPSVVQSVRVLKK